MIRNLLFDLGGVIINIDRMLCVKAFKALGMENIEEFLGDYGQKGAFGDLEQGLITPEQWREEVRRHIPHPVTDQEIDTALNEFLLDIPLARLEALRKLREKYRIYLLSNTNKVMWDARIADEFTHEGLTREDYFDGLTTSFEVKEMKPDAAIFRRVVEDHGILPEETIFFDDSEANCRAAEALGFHAVVVRPGTEFYELLDDALATM